MHYSEIYNDMFRPYKWAIIRLLVEPMGRLYTPKINVRRDLVPLQTPSV